MFCYSQLLQPYSRGEILLQSTDPHEHPYINPNYYEDERDLRNVVEGNSLNAFLTSYKYSSQKKKLLKIYQVLMLNLKTGIKS